MLVVLFYKCGYLSWHFQEPADGVFTRFRLVGQALPQMHSSSICISCTGFVPRLAYILSLSTEARTKKKLKLNANVNIYAFVLCIRFMCVFMLGHKDAHSTRQ